MRPQCSSCGLPMLTEQVADTLHITPCPLCAHREWTRGYDKAMESVLNRIEEATNAMYQDVENTRSVCVRRPR